MRQGPNHKRTRGRGNGRKGGNSRNQAFESNGPEVKVRGNAQQVVEKYLALARDASSTGDRIDAESYYQFAEHYYRVMNANAASEQQRQPQNTGHDGDTGSAQTVGAAEAGETSQFPQASGGENGLDVQNGRSRRRNSRGNNRETATGEDPVAQSGRAHAKPEEHVKEDPVEDVGT